MTIDEAIKHATEVSETCDNKECGLDHKQLAKWLEELKELRYIHIQDELEKEATFYADKNIYEASMYGFPSGNVRDKYNAVKCAYKTGFLSCLNKNIKVNV